MLICITKFSRSMNSLFSTKFSIKFSTAVFEVYTVYGVYTAVPISDMLDTAVHTSKFSIFEYRVTRAYHCALVHLYTTSHPVRASRVRLTVRAYAPSGGRCACAQLTNLFNRVLALQRRGLLPAAGAADRFGGRSACRSGHPGKPLWTAAAPSSS